MGNRSGGGEQEWGWGGDEHSTKFSKRGGGLTGPQF